MDQLGNGSLSGTTSQRLTQHRKNLNSCKTGLAQSLGVEWGLADQAVRPLLPSQVAVRKPAVHLDLC